MRFTDNYRLGSVQPGEPLNPIEDSRRMLTIDRQLLGLFEVFGNGIIQGWEITRSAGLNVSITSGKGHISFTSSVTSFPRTVSLQSNATNWIYAKLSEDGAYTRDAIFFATSAPLAAGEDAVFLGMVGTNLSSVSKIDMTGRNDISFIESIKQLISQHRHKGGTNNPSRINLQTEVMGKLPGYRIDGIDTEKIISGKLSPARMPTLEHGDLLHSGILTHSQIDSFVRNLSNPNVRLLGELSTINLLQLYLAHKHIWNDSDLFATNLIVMVPGISKDSFNDYDNTTALIDKYNHTIQGIPSSSGKLHTITLKTDSDFRNAVARINLDIQTDQSGTKVHLTRPLEDILVEGFDNVFSDETAIPGWTVKTSSSITSPNKSSFLSDSSKKEDGTYSAKFHIEQQLTVQAMKDFENSVDWTKYNIIQTSVSSLTLVHGQIRMQLLGQKTNDTYLILDDFLLLNNNETTKGFKTVSRDISNITRDKVQGIRIYTDTSLGWEPSSPIDVNVDTIKIINSIYYDPFGYIRFRFQTPQKSKWMSISWDGDDNGGKITAKGRSAPNFAVIDQAISTPFGSAIYSPGEDPHVPENTNFEAEIDINSNDSNTSSPILRSVTISYITSSEDTGIIIDSVNDFMRAEGFVNTKVISNAGQHNSEGEEKGSVIIDGRNDTGDIVYGLSNSIQQSTFEKNSQPVLGITGGEIFSSPWQAATKDLYQRLIKRKSGFDGVAHVQRLEDRTYLIADTFNDRVLLLDKNGNIKKGFVSNNVRTEKSLYPMVSIFNKNLKTIYVAWSTNISLNENFDLSKFMVNGSGLSVTLNGNKDKVSSISGLPGDAGTTSANVIAILLGEDHYGEIVSYLENQGEDSKLYIDIDQDAVPGGIDKTSSNYASLSTPRGLPVSIADVMFVPGIYRPISCIISKYTNNWIICNAKSLSSDTDPVTGVSKNEIVSILEIDQNNGQITYSDNSIDFSTITLGGIAEYNEKYLVMAGISSEQYPPPNTISSNTITQTLGSGTISTDKTTTITAVNKLDSGSTVETKSQTTTEFSELDKYRGRVKIVEKKSGRSVFDELTSDGTYASDVQIDSDNNLVIIERYYEEDKSSPIPIGRGRIIKMDEDGNIFWQYGLGVYESFNDVRLLDTGNAIICS